MRINSGFAHSEIIPKKPNIKRFTGTKKTEKNSYPDVCETPQTGGEKTESLVKLKFPVSERLGDKHLDYLLFISFWLHCIFIAVHGLSLVVERAAICCSVRASLAQALGARVSVVAERGSAVAARRL